MLSEDERKSLEAQVGRAPPNQAQPELAQPLPQPIVTLENCVIRSYHPSDAEGNTAQANNPKVVTYMTNGFPHPYSVQDAHNWIERCGKENPGMNFAICGVNNTDFMGGIGLKPRVDIHERTVEVGYWLGESYWGKGIMSQVLRGFTDWVFTTRPHVARIEASVVEGNEGSRKVLAREGYVFEGTLRKQIWKREKLLDAYMYAVIREDWEKRLES